MADKKDLIEKIMALKAKKAKVSAPLDDMIEMYSAKLRKAMEEDDRHTEYGDTGMAFFRPNPTAEVNDWDAVQTYVIKHKAFDILSKRISVAALQRRINAGENVPGVSLKAGGRSFIVQSLKSKGEKDEEASD